MNSRWFEQLYCKIYEGCDWNYIDFLNKISNYKNIKSTTTGRDTEQNCLGILKKIDSSFTELNNIINNNSLTNCDDCIGNNLIKNKVDDIKFYINTFGFFWWYEVNIFLSELVSDSWVIPEKIYNQFICSHNKEVLNYIYCALTNVYDDKTSANLNNYIFD